MPPRAPRYNLHRAGRKPQLPVPAREPSFPSEPESSIEEIDLSKLQLSNESQSHQSKESQDDDEDREHDRLEALSLVPSRFPYEIYREILFYLAVTYDVPTQASCVAVCRDFYDLVIHRIYRHVEIKDLETLGRLFGRRRAPFTYQVTVEPYSLPSIQRIHTLTIHLPSSAIDVSLLPSLHISRGVQYLNLRSLRITAVDGEGITEQNKVILDRLLPLLNPFEFHFHSRFPFSDSNIPVITLPTSTWDWDILERVRFTHARVNGVLHPRAFGESSAAQPWDVTFALPPAAEGQESSEVLVMQTLESLCGGFKGCGQVIVTCEKDKERMNDAFVKESMENEWSSEVVAGFFQRVRVVVGDIFE